MRWDGIVVAALVAAVALGAMAQGPPAVELELEHPDGTPVAWDRWIRSHGPVAMVVWASWAPRSERVLRELPGLAEAAGEKGLSLVLVAVQEPAAESRKALGSIPVTWFHDGRGSVLKRFRVVSVPSIVILDGSDGVVDRLEATVEALRSWERR